MSTVRFKPFGNQAFIVCIEGPLAVETTEVLKALRSCIVKAPFPLHAHFAYAELLVEVVNQHDFEAVFAFAKTCSEAIEKQQANQLPRSEQALVYEIPVRYDGEDIDGVARALGIEVSEVIKQHSSVEYHVYALGFQPGFAFMAPVVFYDSPPDNSIWSLGRRDVPRKRVAINSVAIAAGQTAIYPHASPGGWQLLGTALRPVFDRNSPELSLVKPGDRVRFIPSEV